MRYEKPGGHIVKPPIVIIGIGELAGVFAKGFLRGGHPVYPVTRDMNMIEEAQILPDPQLVLVAVAEKDYHLVMKTIPLGWRDHLVLLQNELLPGDWEAYDIGNPTVISVWFEKKKGMEYHAILPSPVYGAMAGLVADALERIAIPCKVLDSKDELIYELVLKNVFVLTINITGLVLEEGSTTGMLWHEHQKLALDVADNIIDLQEFITGKNFVRNRLREGLLAGIKGDPDHKCKGRSAPDRLARMVKLADKAGLKVPTIIEIHRRLNT